MAFTTRVELQGAAWDDYEILHQEMAKMGFSRTIRSDTGTVYHLPQAEYNYEGEGTRSQVLEAVKHAAARTGQMAKILVTEAKTRSWYGLEQVKQSTYSY